MLAGIGLLSVTFVVPALNPGTVPRPDLTGLLAVIAIWIAESGGKYGIPVIGLTMTLFLVYRPGLPARQRVIEALVIITIVAVVLGGGAFLNEYVIKPVFAVPRPNILELAQTPPESPTLKMTVIEFYSMPVSSRSEHLQSVLSSDIRLAPLVREHWVSESGYSFPSGHSFSSILFATFFLSLGLNRDSGQRIWIYYVLVPWAVAVCYSRPILRVHSPTDVCLGGLEGMMVGFIAFLLAQRAFEVLIPPEASQETGNTPNTNA